MTTAPVYRPPVYRDYRPALAEAMSCTSPPLLTRTGGDATGGAALASEVTITDTGAAILTGRMDRVHACGVDRWLGGVRVQGSAAVWRWDDTRQQVCQS